MVSFVMVTYGKRMNYVFNAIEPILNSTNALIILVCNGVDNKAYEELVINFDRYLNSRLILIKNTINEGSSGGFYLGMEKALSVGKEYTVLLDDDNYLSVENLTKLNDFLIKKTNVAYACYRKDRRYMTDLINGVATDNVFPKQNSFMGVSLNRILNKFFKLKRNHQSYNNKIKINWAPYGGLIIRTEWLANIGLPRRDYYLYADDTEFTYRIKNIYGLELLPFIVIEDLEKSWNVSSNRNLFSRLLLDGEDWKVYYSVRNQAHFDFNLYSNSKIKCEINILLFMMILTLFFVFFLFKDRSYSRLSSRFFLLGKACVQGVTGQLGKLND